MNIKIPITEHPTICEKATRLDRTVKSVAEEYGVSSACIERILARSGRKRGHRKYAIDESYFEKVDTPNKAYFLGLIYADGCNKRNGISLSLQEEDGYLVEALKREVAFKGKTYLIKRKKAHHKLRVGVELSSMKMMNDITLLGVVPNKSLILQFPTCVSEGLMSHFIRGYFDGDGSVHVDGSGGFHCSITGSPFFCQSLHEYLTKRLSINSTVCDYSHSKAKDVKMSTCQALVFLDYIYRDSTIRMTRKFDRFINFLKSYNPKRQGSSVIPNERLNAIKIHWLQTMGETDIRPTVRNEPKQKYLGITPETRAKIGASNRKTEIERYGQEEAAKRRLARAGKRIGVKRGPLVPVTINDHIYPSMHAAARALNLSVATVKKRYVLKTSTRPIQLNTTTP